MSDKKSPRPVSDCRPLMMGEPKKSRDFDSTHSIIWPFSSRPRKFSLRMLSRMRSMKARLVRWRIDSKKKPTLGCTMLNTLEMCAWILFCSPKTLRRPDEQNNKLLILLLPFSSQVTILPLPYWMKRKFWSHIKWNGKTRAKVCTDKGSCWCCFISSDCL